MCTCEAGPEQRGRAASNSEKARAVTSLGRLDIGSGKPTTVLGVTLPTSLMLSRFRV